MAVLETGRWTQIDSAQRTGDRGQSGGSVDAVGVFQWFLVCGGVDGTGARGRKGGGEKSGTLEASIEGLETWDGRRKTALIRLKVNVTVDDVRPVETQRSRDPKARFRLADLQTCTEERKTEAPGK